MMEERRTCECGDAQHVRTLRRLKSDLLVLEASIHSKEFQVTTSRQHLCDLRTCYTDLEHSLHSRLAQVTVKEQCKPYSVLQDQTTLHNEQEGMRREREERSGREVEEMRGNREELIRELGGLGREIDQGKGEKAALESRAVALEGEIKDLLEAVASNIEGESKLREEIAAVETELETAEAALQEEMRNRERNLQKKADLLQKLQQKEDFSRQIQAKKDANRLFSLQEDEKTHQKALLLKSKNNDISSDLAAQELLMASYEREIEENMQAITLLCSHLDSYTQELASLNSQSAENTLETEGIRADLASLHRETEEVRTERERQDREVRELEGQVARYGLELRTQRNAARVKEQALIAAEERVQTYIQQIQSRSHLLDSTHLQINQERNQLQVTSDGLEATLESLRNDEFRLKSELEEYRNRDLLGTSKLLYDSESVLRREAVEVAEKTMHRKHSEQVRLLEEERRRLEFRAEGVGRVLGLRTEFGE